MDEKVLAKKQNGMLVLVGSVALYVVAVFGLIAGSAALDEGSPSLLFIVSLLYVIFGWMFWMGLKVVGPQEALVLTLFGKYYGTLRGPGFFFVNPFCTAVNPAAETRLNQSGDAQSVRKALLGKSSDAEATVEKSKGKRVSLKAMTLSNNKQKINDLMGTPVEISIAVIWRVVDTAKAVFDVDNYKEFLSLQCDSALRDIVRMYPYDVAPGVDTTGDGIADEGSLRGSSEAVAKRLREEIQNKVNIAGIEIIEARITHLAYAPEIASAMLQRQQAAAVVAARATIVEGAVGMVDTALKALEESSMVELDDERKAAMVSNLLVVLCGNHDAQPIVNSGSLY